MPTIRLKNSPWIVCAALKRKDGRIICGPRHFDSIMHSQRCGEDWKGAEQGFVDQYGKFYSRKDAYVIAKENDQIAFRCGGDEGQLFSENLY